MESYETIKAKGCKHNCHRHDLQSIKTTMLACLMSSFVMHGLIKWNRWQCITRQPKLIWERPHHSLTAICQSNPNISVQSQCSSAAHGKTQMSMAGQSECWLAILENSDFDLKVSFPVRIWTSTSYTGSLTHKSLHPKQHLGGHYRTVCVS